jgi:hypothetical protein
MFPIPPRDKDHDLGPVGLLRFTWRCRYLGGCATAYGCPEKHDPSIYLNWGSQIPDRSHFKFLDMSGYDIENIEKGHEAVDIKT